MSAATTNTLRPARLSLSRVSTAIMGRGCRSISSTKPT